MAALSPHWDYLNQKQEWGVGGKASFVTPAGWEPALAAGATGCPGVLQVTVPKFHQDNNKLLLHPHPFWAGGGSPGQTPPSWDAAAFPSQESGFVLSTQAPPGSAPKIPAETGLEWGAEVTKGAGGDRDSSLPELGAGFVQQSPLPLPARGCLQLPGIAVATGNFLPSSFAKPY